MYLFHLLIIQQQEHQLTDHNRIIIFVFFPPLTTAKQLNCGKILFTCRESKIYINLYAKLGYRTLVEI